MTKCSAAYVRHQALIFKIIPSYVAVTKTYTCSHNKTIISMG